MKKLLIMQVFFLLMVSINAQYKVYDPVKVYGDNNGSYYMNPKISPDGSKLAFTGSNYKGIYILDINTKALTTLTDENAAGFGYSWASNSSYILSRPCKFDNQNRYNVVKLYNVATKEAKALTDYRTIMPALPSFALNDQKIVLNTRGNLELFESGITSAKKITTNKFVYVQSDKLMIHNIAEKKINTVSLPISNRIINLVTSPDENYAAFQIVGGNMYVLNIADNSLVDLGKGERPSFSPDSKYIVYQVMEDNGENFTSSELYIIGIDGKEKQKLTDSKDVLESNPSFSSDGSTIFFSSMNDGAIYSMKILK